MVPTNTAIAIKVFTLRTISTSLLSPLFLLTYPLIFAGSVSKSEKPNMFYFVFIYLFIYVFIYFWCRSKMCFWLVLIAAHISGNVPVSYEFSHIIVVITYNTILILLLIQADFLVICIFLYEFIHDLLEIQLQQYSNIISKKKVLVISTTDLCMITNTFKNTKMFQ